MFRKWCSSWVVVIDTVFLLSVLFALDKASSHFLWGGSQDLGVPAEANGVTRAMQDACFLTLWAKLLWLAFPETLSCMASS